MASNPKRIQTVLDDIVAYVTPELAVFTEREHGTQSRNSELDEVQQELDGRSIWIFRFTAGIGWRLIYQEVTRYDQDRVACSECSTLRMKCMRPPSSSLFVEKLRRIFYYVNEALMVPHPAVVFGV